MSERYCWSVSLIAVQKHKYITVFTELDETGSYDTETMFPGPSSIALQLPSLSFLINRWLYLLQESPLTVANSTELQVSTAGVGTEHKLRDQLQQVIWQGIQYQGGLQSLAAVSVAWRGPDSKDVLFQVDTASETELHSFLWKLLSGVLKTKSSGLKISRSCCVVIFVLCGPLSMRTKDLHHQCSLTSGLTPVK